MEVFDRQYNFRGNALIEPTEFQFDYDFVSMVKNTIVLYKSPLTVRETNTGTAGDMTIALSDFIVINLNGDYEAGIVTKLEAVEDTLTIVYTNFLSLFNHEVLIPADEIKHTSIEDYIKKLLDESFVTNDDESQVIPGMTTVKKTTTYGVFDYNDTTEVYVVINILKDLIFPAFNKYLIGIFIDLNIPAKTMTVNIGRRLNYDDFTIEADLPNIIDTNIVIRQSTNDTNKLTLVDIANYDMTEYHYYLHQSDYSWSSTDSDRILPVVNDVYQFDSDLVTEERFWASAKYALTIAEKYININRDLTANEKSLLEDACAELQPYFSSIRTAAQWENYYNSIQEAIVGVLMSSRVPFRDDTYTRVANYAELQEEGTGHYCVVHGTADPYFRYVVHTEKGTTSGLDSNGIPNSRYPSTSSGWETITEEGTALYNTNTHVDLHVSLTLTIYIILNGYGTDITTYNYNLNIYTPLSSNDFSTAINNYKQSAAYATEYAAYKAANLTAIVNGYARGLFSNAKYKNLIELTLTKDDSLIMPLRLPISRPVNIIHNGVTYSSILTGYSILKNGLCKLIFGLIRVELTKILNMKGV